MKNGGGGNVKSTTLVEQSNTNTTPNPNPRRIRGWARRGREISGGEEESKESDSLVGAF